MTVRHRVCRRTEAALRRARRGGLSPGRATVRPPAVRSPARDPACSGTPIAGDSDSRATVRMPAATSAHGTTPAGSGRGPSSATTDGEQPDQAGGQGRRIGAREDASRCSDRVPEAWHVVADRDGAARGRLRHDEPPALADGRGHQGVRAGQALSLLFLGHVPEEVHARAGRPAKPRLLRTAPDHPHLRIGQSGGGRGRRPEWRAQGACWRSAVR